MRKLRGQGDFGGLVFGAIVLGILGLAGFGGYRLWQEHFVKVSDACYWQANVIGGSDSCLIDRPFRDDERGGGCITTEAVVAHRAICSSKPAELAVFAQSAGRRICEQSTTICVQGDASDPLDGILAAGRTIGVTCDYFTATRVGGRWVADLCDAASCRRADERWTCERKSRRP